MLFSFLFFILLLSDIFQKCVIHLQGNNSVELMPVPDKNMRLLHVNQNRELNVWPKEDGERTGAKWHSLIKFIQHLSEMQPRRWKHARHGLGVWKMGGFLFPSVISRAVNDYDVSFRRLWIGFTAQLSRSNGHVRVYKLEHQPLQPDCQRSSTRICTRGIAH